MSATQVLRCNNCNKAHKVKIRDPNSNKTFDFTCRCMNKITGSFNSGSWTVNNATSTERKEDEAVYMHEPEPN